MSRLIVLATVLMAAVLMAAGTATAHKTYKGHSCYFWFVQVPSGSISWRECYDWGWSSGGVHRHDYVDQWWTGSVWKTAHWHYGRLAPEHPS